VFNPSSGFYHSITLEEAGMLPAILNNISHNILYSQYFKFLLLNYFYFDMSPGTGSRVLAIANRIGWIAEFGKGENIIPIASQYKFFSGGGNSVRGWKAQDNGMLENTLNGGKFLFEGTFEYRWMLFPENTNFLKDIGTVFFLDYGNVWEAGKQFKLSENALAIGFGLRYYTFVGPIRIDVGFKLYDPRAKDGRKWLTRYNFEEIFSDRLAFQFGLGNAF
jgi:outer membrane protein assembly factor BamA